jgi:hypothetical protein
MKFMIKAILFLAVATTAQGQLLTYGPPSPAPFNGMLSSGGQLPFVGNTLFNLQITGASNTLGGAIGVSVAQASIPIGSVLLLIDPSSLMLLDLPAPATFVGLPLPPVPGLAGAFGYVQAALVDPGLPGGLGLTNGVFVTALPNRTPTRAFFGGQDFSGGAATGQLSVLDLTTVPPSFRATGALGFSGTISTNYSPKIAVAENAGIAYALGNATTNQFVRVFDVSTDPTGVVTWPSAGDIPIAQEIPPSVGRRDMEVLENNALLFVTSGAGSSTAAVVLDVFDVSGVPTVLPTAPVQTLSFGGAGGGTAGLDLSADGSQLALLLGTDTFAAVTLYDIVVGSPQPLVFSGSFSFQNFTTSLTPNDVHFSPDGTLLFVSGGNGAYAVVDLAASTPTILIDGATWSTNGTTTTHGSAIGIRDGALVAVLGEPATTGGALYNVLDLNTTALGFGQPITSFTTNPGANISNHRSHGRQSIVIAIDGTGATANCQFVDIIDLAQPSGAGFVAWRVQMPSTTSLTPAGLSCIPRDFDLF